MRRRQGRSYRLLFVGDIPGANPAGRRAGMAGGKGRSGAVAGGRGAGRKKQTAGQRLQRRRLAAAVLLVVGMLVAVPVSGMLERAGVPGVGSEAAVALLQGAPGTAAAGQEGSGAEDMLLGGGQQEGAQAPALPAGFQEEVVPMDGYTDVRVQEGLGVVGFCAQGGAADAFAAVAVHLRERGWVQVESGSPSAGSFVKQEGAYRWAFVTCTEVAGQTSIVMSLQEKEV